MMRIKKHFFVFFASALLASAPFGTQKAYAWDAMPAELMKQAMEEISKHIDGISLSMLQQQAMKMLNSQLGSLVGGSSQGGAKFITDWQQVLEKDPTDVTKLFVNSGIDSSLKGKGSLSQYVSAGSASSSKSNSSNTKSNSSTSSSSTSSSTKSSSGSSASSLLSEGFGSLLGLGSSGSSSGGGSYANKLATLAKQSTTEYKGKVFDFEGDPSKITEDGTWQKLGNLLDEDKINTPYAFVDYWKDEYSAKLDSEKEIAQTKAIAYQGFVGTGDDKGKGTITNPGILIKEKVANTQDIGNKIIASATHPEQIISAIVSQMMTQSVTKGMGDLDKQISQLTSKVTSAAKSAVSEYGPGALYGNASTSSSSTTKK